MAKDTSRLNHADYVVGTRALNALRHAAAVSAPAGGASRADRRANMAAFRDARLAETRRAETVAAFKAMPAVRSKVAAVTLAAPLPRPDKLIAAVASRAEMRDTRDALAVHAVAAHDLALRDAVNREGLANWLARFAPFSAH